ncbi:diphosphomevalonate decarboxylase [Candidatus Roizmanbacteria bacterium RIFCSPLOWO2_01_FULL_37_12]|uniref:diphosphomevalonate decarboxylase n=1 Tax=Candidatus Roizmanbacteria bacterium RIFCSPLOWO2_01_FULL_37_12 TaxID=1802056 RepID=A0A1F7IEA0_9BACT|nr:MAG: diphosphomevalonate decarboxylase [Candidatus Roizmanbacteria bacterium RIFCSPHIGHO2_02_FULL_37_9b]OGK41699.1 MAG: diphosphomevalonate decarboxylase [Candidatus Roizmanbacteria bacterium RIFCSPLOWO2_01_FULL_37_12]
MKATAVAPSNIAFIKYWGKKVEKLRIPSNGSVSVNLSNLLTTTTVEFSPKLKKDIIFYNKKIVGEGRTHKRVIAHLNRIRNLAKINYKAKTITQTNFPDSVGLASSASGYAALTVAASNAAGLKLSEKDLTILARVASGSACRSIPDGFVEWLEGNSHESSYALSIFPPDYWKLTIVVVVVGREKKQVSSTQGHRVVKESPFFKSRLKNIKKKITDVKKFIKEKNFAKFGHLVEREALELHALTLTSNPPIIYWQPETVRLMNLIQIWKQEGLEIYFSIDAGPNLFLFSKENDTNDLLKKLRDNKFNDFILNKPASGARLIKNDLS